MNQHNARILGPGNPQALEEVPMKSGKVVVWCAIQKNIIIGPYFFRRSSVDSVAYKSMLRYYRLQHAQQLPASPIIHCANPIGDSSPARPEDRAPVLKLQHILITNSNLVI